MNSTLRELDVYNVAHEKKIKEQDYINYLSGEYYFDALVAALGNVFAKKGSKQKSYRDIREKPLLDGFSSKEPEIDEQTAWEQYKCDRMIDKMNWDLAQIYANKDGEAS